jgi:predicted ribosome quality control (RQC) complex YloA/Tae2 family protein
MPHPTFDSLTVAAVVAELQSLCGGHIQRIAQPGAQSVVLSVYAAGRGQTHWLFDGSGRWFRAHAVARRPPSTPAAAPPAFCMALRKYLDGGRILAIRQRGFDRLIEVEVRGYEGAIYRLAAELMGRNSNLLLIGPGERVLHAARFVPADKPRPVLPGLPYAPPPASGRADPRTVERGEFLHWRAGEPAAEFTAWLASRFEGMSRFLAAEIAARVAGEGAQAEWQAFDAVLASARENAWQPVALFEGERIAGAYPLPPQSTSDLRAEPRASISAALAEYYEQAILRAAVDDERQALRRALQKVAEKRAAALMQIARGVAEGERADTYRRWGEAILANLRAIHKGQSAAELPDYYADPPATMAVPLDATLTPQENAARWFDRARRITANHEHLLALQRQMQSEQARVQAALERVEAASDADALRALRAEAVAQGWLSGFADGAVSRHAAQASFARASFEGKKIRAFTSPDGYTVLVGENAEANDYLVQRVAAPDDWWLHVRAHAGSHVVIRTAKAPEKVPSSTLLFAAHLAAAKSAVRHTSGVDVDYTLRKYVRRPRQAAPGQVLITHEKTLRVESEVVAR